MLYYLVFNYLRMSFDEFLKTHQKILGKPNSFYYLKNLNKLSLENNRI